jgi:hypothetical protein
MSKCNVATHQNLGIKVTILYEIHIMNVDLYSLYYVIDLDLNVCLNHSNLHHKCYLKNKHDA